MLRAKSEETASNQRGKGKTERATETGARTREEIEKWIKLESCGSRQGKDIRHLRLPSGQKWTERQTERQTDWTESATTTQSIADQITPLQNTTPSLLLFLLPFAISY